MILKTVGKLFLTFLLILLIFAAVILVFLFTSPSVGKQPDRDEQELLQKRSGQYRDGSFHNENEVGLMTGEGYPPSSRRTPGTMLAAQEPAFRSTPLPDTLTYTWFGHSSFLLQLGESNVLVDPVLGNRASPVDFAGPARFSELPLKAEELPEIDVLFISHDHYDHLDYRTIRSVRDRVKNFVVPLGVDSILAGWGVEKDIIHALDWWESVELDGVTFTLTPSQHFTGRNPLKRNRTLWGGVFMENAHHRVYYTGDGGYYAVFGEIRERLGAPVLMIAECGQYDPRWAKSHMFPEETVQAGLDAGTEWLIPVHWGSFCICNHAWDDSIRRVTAAADGTALRLAAPQIGRTVDMSELASCSEHWWEDFEDRTDPQGSGRQ